MSYMFKKFFVVLFFPFFLFIFTSNAHASTLYLSPGSANIPQGSVVSVRVGLNTGGESVNGVSAYLAYPADKLEVAWISYGGSFPIAAEGGYGGGGIRISRGSISGVSGNVNVATVGFRGKTQGSATVSFIGGSGAPRASDSSDSLNLGGSTGGTFQVTAPVPGGQSSGNSSGSQTGQPAVQDQTAPAISNVEVISISSDSATISWKTNEKADSEVEYGLEAGEYFISSSEAELILEHKINIEGVVLEAGAMLHFRVKSRDASGNEAVSADSALQLKGYLVTVKVLDEQGMPLADTQVLLYGEESKSVTTSQTGEAVFADVRAGKHLIVVKVGDILEKTGEIVVKDDALSQTFTLGVNRNLKDSVNYYYLAVIGAVILAAIILAIAIIKRRKKQNTPPPPAPAVPPQPVNYRA